MNQGSLHTRTDSELIQLYKSQQVKEAIGILFKRYTHVVFSVCMKYLKNRDDAEDAVMQIFEALLIKLPKHEVKEFRFWLHTVSKNHCLMKLRKEQSILIHQNQLKKEAEVFMEIQTDPHHERGEWKEHLLNEMNNALLTLNEPQRVCVELFYLHNKSYQEIVEQTGYTMNEVRSHIQNGKRNLKTQLEKTREQ